MKISDALKYWGYENSRRRRKQLKQLCIDQPEICTGVKPFDIKTDIVKPYLLDKGNKDIYSHIIYATRRNAHLYPVCFNTDDDHLKKYIKELCKEGIIVKLPHKNKVATENYIETIKAEKWLRKRRSDRLKHFTDAISPIVPDVVVKKPNEP